MKNSLIFGFLCLMFLVLAGCASSDSEDIRTTGIYAKIQVIAENQNSARVIVDLNVGGPTGSELNLSDGDRLRAHANGKIEQLEKKHVPILNTYSYTTDFSNFDMDNEEFRVSFEREEGTSAPNSSVIMPKSFTIMAPLPNAIFFKTDQIPINWSPASTGKLWIDLSVTCSWEDDQGSHTSSIYSPREVSDTGTYVLNLLTVNLLKDFTLVGGECGGSIILIRKRYGSLDSNYGEGGYITARQTRSVSIVIQE